MKLRLKFIAPKDRKPDTSYLMVFVTADKEFKCGMNAVTAELQVQRTEDEGMGHWERVELETTP